jgi:hypothetical protein
MRAFRRAAVLAVLGLILGAPWAAALEARSEKVSYEATREARNALDHLHSFWSLLARAWSKEGAGGDPLGRPGTAPTSGVKCDEGPAMDPLGGCGSGNQ